MPIKKILSGIPIFLAIILFLNGVCYCSTSEITSISQLNNPRYTVGTDTGGPVNQNVREYLPEAKLLTFDSFLSEYTALQSRKVDAFACNETEFLAAKRNGIKNVKRLPGVLGNPISIAAGISDSSKIPELREKFNSFIAKIKADGTLTAMYQRWVYDGNTDMPKIDVPEKSDIHLTVGTTGLVMPFSFYIQSKIAGFDVELARRFAAYIGAEIEFKLYDFFSILMALKIGNIDIALSNIYITPERSENITFSDPIYKQNSIVVICSEEEAAAPEESEIQKRIPKYKTFAELDGKNIGMQPGIIDWEEWAAENLPHSKIQYYNTYSDLASALKTHKIEGFLVDSPVLALMAAEDNELAAINEYVGESFGYYFVSAKTERGKKLCDEMSEYIRKIKASGELDAIHSIWQGADEAAKIPPDFKNLPAKNGTVTYAAEGSYPPFTYYKGNELAGIDIDIVVRFCKAYGYGLNVQTMFFDAMLPAVNSGKIDFAGDFTPSEEHKEAVYFSESYCEAHSLMACLRAEKQTAWSLDEGHDAAYDNDDEPSFWEDVASSFNKTFIREKRWELFIEGITNTMIITVSSILCGIMLGFIAFMFCRTGNRAANAVTKFYVWLIKGTPIVVLLMILYYIIFGRVNISGIVVSIIAFTLTFSTSVYRMLTFGTGAVDRGQTEAAYALGFTDLQTFFTVILPQAALHLMPSFKEEVTMLIKSTSVVGYIAVQDLTKMGDIIRSRTYEAFFPLIAIAVIYFILAGLLNIIADIIKFRITPSKRKPENILSGIDTSRGNKNYD